MKRKLVPIVVVLAVLCVVGVYAVWPMLSGHSPEAKAGGARPANWAVPIEKPGLANLHRVSPDLYRGAQPTAEGMRELKKMGVKTVLNLRALHSDRDELGDTELAYEHIDMKPWHAESEDVIKFLKIASDKAKTPVFVHCQHGADRTGTMCAIYRVVVQGWSKDDAIREMKEGGYGHHTLFKNLPKFIENLDVEKLRQQIGLPATP